MDLPPVVMEDKDRERIMADMTRFTGHVPPEVPLDLSVQEASDIHQEILSHAKSLHADLLVIGSHGRTGFERLLLGSVTERLIGRLATVLSSTVLATPRGVGVIV